MNDKHRLLEELGELPPQGIGPDKVSDRKERIRQAHRDLESVPAPVFVTHRFSSIREEIYLPFKEGQYDSKRVKHIAERIDWVLRVDPQLMVSVKFTVTSHLTRDKPTLERDQRCEENEN